MALRLLLQVAAEAAPANATEAVTVAHAGSAHGAATPSAAGGAMGARDAAVMSMGAAVILLIVCLLAWRVNKVQRGACCDLLLMGWRDAALDREAQRAAAAAAAAAKAAAAAVPPPVIVVMPDAALQCAVKVAVGADSSAAVELATAHKARRSSGGSSGRAERARTAGTTLHPYTDRLHPWASMRQMEALEAPAGDAPAPHVPVWIVCHSGTSSSSISSSSELDASEPLQAGITPAELAATAAWPAAAEGGAGAAPAAGGAAAQGGAAAEAAAAAGAPKIQFMCIQELMLADSRLSE